MTEALTDRLLRATVGSCTCMTKTPELKHHDSMCHYRLFEEAREALIGAENNTDLHVPAGAAKRLWMGFDENDEE